VWISEVMLQQTQVTTVIPYFERWMKRFPDLGSLAAADQDDVLGHWAGLGYYARARNLHKTARLCVEEHRGALPKDPEQLNALPGIGESTANAIVSQAHDVPLAILDGNAKRVLARHGAVDGWPGKSAVMRALWNEAEVRLPPNRGAEYTQAIMDLGATLCTRNKPGCLSCPVQQDCKARLAGEIERYPGKKVRKAVPQVDLHWLILRRPEAPFGVLLEQRPGSGIWGGLWCPPQAGDVTELTGRFGLPGADLRALPMREHRLTHRLFRIHPWLVDASPDFGGVECNGALAWQGVGQWNRLGLPKPVADVLAELAQYPIRNETTNQEKTT
jgi:A/G-specific adenine glycosylase